MTFSLSQGFKKPDLTDFCKNMLISKFSPKSYEDEIFTLSLIMK